MDKALKWLIRARKADAPHVLLIYTGGTFGMAYDAAGQRVPMPLSDLKLRVPELKQLACHLSIYTFEKLIDSADIAPIHWQGIGRLLNEHYYRYDGFVILHGTDTMAYTASALSYMMQGIQKAVVLTGAQVPIGHMCSDAKENLLLSLRIAAEQHEQQKGISRVPGISIYFRERLMRGNRATKVSTEALDAFRSPNYPLLAQIQSHIVYFDERIQAHYAQKSHLRYVDGFDTNILSVNFFPGCSVASLQEAVSAAAPRALILHTYGTGNIVQSNEWVTFLKEQIAQGRLVFNQSQCLYAHVRAAYSSGRHLAEIGVISTGELTQEAALVKIMFLLAQHPDPKGMKAAFVQPIAGEGQVAATND